MRRAEEVSEQVSPEDIIRFVQARGMRVTRAQLVRWQKAGLIPHPRRLPRDEGRGTRSEYPGIALGQAYLVAFTLRRISRSFDVVRWVLWHFGYPGLTEDVRRMLVRDVNAKAAEFDRAYAAFQNEEEGNPIEHASSSVRIPKLWADERRAVGRTRAVTPVRMVHEMVLGDVEALNQYDAPDWQLMGRVLASASGIDALRTADPDYLRQEFSIATAEGNIANVVAALEDAPEETLIFIRDEAAMLYRVFRPDLSPAEPSIPPPYFFLTWFIQRYVSPTLNAAINKRAEEPGWPRPEEPMLYRLARAQMAARRRQKRRTTHSSTKRRKPRRKSR